MQTEHATITKMFMTCTVFLVGYVVIICYWIATDQEYSESTSELQFYTLGSMALIIRSITLIMTLRVMRNFGKGLRSYFDQGSHYIDFWGQSNQNLLGETVDDVEEGFFDKDAGNNLDGMSGMSSRSRIESDDFD